MMLIKNQLFIVVDMQNDFSDKGAIAVKGATKLAKQIQKFIKPYEDAKHAYIAFSLDWHPRKHCSFEKWPKHCVKHTKGARLIRPLNLNSADIVIKKASNVSMEETSAFQHKADGLLHQFIIDKEINEVYVMGLVKEVCVLDTCKDALGFGLETYLIEDLTLGINEDAFKDSIPEGLHIIKSSDITN